MYQILLVEDNCELQRNIIRILSESCSISVAGSVSEAKSHLEKSAFQLILLDIELPDGDGFKLCSHVQSEDRHKNTPIIFLTGRGEMDDKLLAFSVGADDYILKPFDTRELRARVLSRVIKSKTKQETSREFCKGDLRFCLDSQRVFIIDAQNSESRAEMTTIEFKLLLYFANHADHVLTRNQVINTVWGESVFISDRTVDSHISKLRKKISLSRCQIVSVLGVGYRFIPSSSVGQSGSTRRVG